MEPIKAKLQEIGEKPDLYVDIEKSNHLNGKVVVRMGEYNNITIDNENNGKTKEGLEKDVISIENVEEATQSVKIEGFRISTEQMKENAKGKTENQIEME